MTNCPYCNVELDSVASCGKFVERGYDCGGKTWDEYRCECPECGKTFYGFEEFEYTGESTIKIEE